MTFARQAWGLVSSKIRIRHLTCTLYLFINCFMVLTTYPQRAIAQQSATCKLWQARKTNQVGSFAWSNDVLVKLNAASVNLNKTITSKATYSYEYNMSATICYENAIPQNSMSNSGIILKPFTLSCAIKVGKTTTQSYDTSVNLGGGIELDVVMAKISEKENATWASGSSKEISIGVDLTLTKAMPAGTSVNDLESQCNQLVSGWRTKADQDMATLLRNSWYFRGFSPDMCVKKTDCYGKTFPGTSWACARGVGSVSPIGRCVAVVPEGVSCCGNLVREPFCQNDWLYPCAEGLLCNAVPDPVDNKRKCKKY